MKKLTCPVCGTEFIPQIADHYVAVTDNAGSGLSRLAGSAKPETYYDAIDCPQCGCQLRPNTRLVEVPEEEEDHEKSWDFRGRSCLRMRGTPAGLWHAGE